MDLQDGQVARVSRQLLRNPLQRDYTALVKLFLHLELDCAVDDVNGDHVDDGELRCGEVRLDVVGWVWMRGRAMGVPGLYVF